MWETFLFLVGCSVAIPLAGNDFVAVTSSQNRPNQLEWATLP